MGLCFRLLKDACFTKFGVYAWYGDLFEVVFIQFYGGGSLEISTNSFIFSFLSSITFYDDKGEFI